MCSPMDNRSCLVFLVVAAALFAGCTANARPESATLSGTEVEAAAREDAEVAAQPDPSSETLAQNVTRQEFGWAMAIGVAGADAQMQTVNAAPIEVPAGTVSLRVEANWTCGTPTCTLHLFLDSPTDQENLLLSHFVSTADAQGDGKATVEAANPQTGEWWASLHAEGVANDVQGTFTITLTPA